jgi:GIY-YIG catalytic domain/NUMOD3 motif
MFHYIYKITNTKNGKYYIGKHSTDKIDDGYFGSGKALNAAIVKYGIENFQKEILEFCKTEIKALEREREIVNEGVVADKKSYNINVGGCSWININSKGKNIYPGHKQQTKKNFRKGRGAVKRLLIQDPKFREDFCKKISEGLKRKIAQTGSWWEGKKHTEETKRKMSKSAKGRIPWNKGIKNFKDAKVRKEYAVTKSKKKSKS